MENKEFIQKWVDALRSGKYTQSTRSLRNSEGFCCLGVACDLKDPNGWENSENSRYSGLGIKTFNYEGSYNDAVLPSLLQTEIGVCEEDVSKVISMNDHGKSFNEIADYLEQTYLKGNYNGA